MHLCCCLISILFHLPCSTPSLHMLLWPSASSPALNFLTVHLNSSSHSWECKNVILSFSSSTLFFFVVFFWSARYERTNPIPHNSELHCFASVRGSVVFNPSLCSPRCHLSASVLLDKELIIVSDSCELGICDTFQPAAGSWEKARKGLTALFIHLQRVTFFMLERPLISGWALMATN